MPIWLRRFTFKQIADFYAEEKSALENKSSGGSKTVVNADGTVNTPEFLQATKQYTSAPKYK